LIFLGFIQKHGRSPTESFTRITNNLPKFKNKVSIIGYKNVTKQINRGRKQTMGKECGEIP